MKNIDTNTNGITSTPGILYPAIKLNNGHIKTSAIRTRNVWNTLMGGFLSYDQFVTDIQQEYYCPGCGRKELLWSSDFTKDNEYTISCDYCKELTFLKPVISFSSLPGLGTDSIETSELLTMLYDSIFAEFSPEYRKFPTNRVQYSELDESWGIYFEIDNQGYELQITKKEA